VSEHTEDTLLHEALHALEQSKQIGRDEERNAIVAWLRTVPYDRLTTLEEIADSIASGEYLT